MGTYLQKLRGVISISLIWAAVWAIMFTALTYLLQLFLPFDSDVGTLSFMIIIGWVGLVSGSIFGILLVLNESGKAIRSLSLGRVMGWGILSSAVYPILTGRANQVFWTFTLGAIVALAFVMLARRADVRNSRDSRGVVDVVLATVLGPIRDIVSPSRESIT